MVARARPPLVSILAFSLVGVAYEVLLMRLFSIAHWHHFAYMVISIALLGFGASGTFVALARRRLLNRYATAYLANGAAFAAAVPAVVALTGQLPFNTLEILWDPNQWLWLLLAYALLATPFFFLANLFALSLSHFPAALGRVYAFDLIGAGLGAAVILLLLYALAPGAALRLLTALATLGCVIATWELGHARWSSWLFLAAAGIVLLVPAGSFELPMTPYKALPQTLLIPGTRVLDETSSPLGRITVVASPDVPFRHAPGMSLAAPAPIPDQHGVFVDGDGPSVITRYDGATTSLDYLDALTSALPYHLLDRPRVLVAGADGDAILQAIRGGASAIDSVELDPARARLLDTRYAAFFGWSHIAERTRLHVGEARAWLARHPATYDLIVFPLAESALAAGTGVRGLLEDFLFTREALARHFAALSDSGLLAVTRWVKLPPRDTLKLLDTAIDVLGAAGIDQPARHLALIRGWKTTTLVVARPALTAAQIERVRSFARTRSFDLVHVPGISPRETNRFNQLDQPYYAEAAAALLSAQRDVFKARYPFAIDAATDDRPYFFQFFRWAGFARALELGRVGGFSFVEWGYPVLVLTAVQAGIASLLLIAAPLLASATQRRQIGRFGGWIVGYFALIGLGFMFLEIAFIQRLTLFLDHPVHAAATVIAALLVFAGIGSRVAQAVIANRDPRPLIGCATLAIALVSAGYVAALPELTELALGWTLPAKHAFVVLGLAPLGLLLGVPFPSGLALLAGRSAAGIPWAWCVNGCASVTGAALAMLVAVHFGFTVVVVCAAAGYLAAGGLGLSFGKR